MSRSRQKPAASRQKNSLPKNNLQKNSQPPTAAPVQRYFAGCGRHWDIPSPEPDLAYTDLVFPECPTCPHRVEPEGVGAGAVGFCTLRPAGQNPFAALAGLLDGL